MRHAEKPCRRWRYGVRNWAAAADRSASPRAAMASLLPAALASQWQLPMITNDHCARVPHETAPECGISAQGSSLSLIHISEPTRLGMISYAVFCLKKKK